MKISGEILMNRHNYMNKTINFAINQKMRHSDDFFSTENNIRRKMSEVQGEMSYFKENESLVYKYECL